MSEETHKRRSEFEMGGIRNRRRAVARNTIYIADRRFLDSVCTPPPSFAVARDANKNVID
jgi:hypothetical protein